MKRTLALALLAILAIPVSHAQQQSLRFYGAAIGNVNRVMIRIDPHVPADVGAGDFTFEFWMKANAADNTPSSGCTTGSNENWITGNILFDRAIWEHDLNGDFGLSIFSNGSSARLAFGMFKGGGGGAMGICGTANVADGQWHHVAITRAASSGAVRIYVDGQIDAQGTGPTGDVSYRNGQPSSVPNYITLNVDNYLGIGAEKYDADGVRYPSYNGFIDEVRLSTSIRYAGTFTPSTVPFAVDAQTAALYHFDEGSGTAIVDAVGTSPGERRFGGNPAGPVWSTDSPFSAAPSPGTLNISPATYSVTEGTANVSISVARTGGTQGAASVSYATSSGTATSGSDFTAASGTLNWNAGEGGSKTFAVPVIDDATVENAETFTVTISNATGAALGGTTSATVTINSNDTAPMAGNVQFTSGTQSVAENGGNVTVTVSRTNGTSGAGTVSYQTASGTATAVSDYSSTSGTLNWAAGDAANKTFSVPIINDAAVESAETFTVALSNATGVGLGSPTTQTITITDDDSPPPPPAGTVQFTASVQSVGESAGQIAIFVSRANGTTGAGTVQYQTSGGTATAGSDYTNTSGTLSWAAGDGATKTFNVPVLNDTSVESAETFNVTLTNATGVTLGTPVSATITITDDDVAPTPSGTVQFTVNAQSVGETGGQITVSVSRMNGTSGTGSVQYQTVGGTATAGADYTSVSGTLNWAGGNSDTKMFTVPVLNDGSVEGAETFNIVLSNAIGVTVGTPATQTITIADDDSPPPPGGTLQFTSNAQSVSESVGTVTFTVSRSSGTGGAASIQYATSNATAQAGSDFTTTSGTLIWADGDGANKTFSVPILNDTQDENTETFNLILSNATGASAGAITTVTVTINDDDDPPPPPPANASSGGGNWSWGWLAFLLMLTTFHVSRSQHTSVRGDIRNSEKTRGFRLA